MASTIAGVPGYGPDLLAPAKPGNTRTQNPPPAGGSRIDLAGQQRQPGRVAVIPPYPAHDDTAPQPIRPGCPFLVMYPAERPGLLARRSGGSRMPPMTMRCRGVGGADLLASRAIGRHTQGPGLRRGGARRKRHGPRQDPLLFAVGHARMPSSYVVPSGYPSDRGFVQNAHEIF